MAITTKLEEHVESLRKYISKTDSKYLINYKENLVVHPIPFFGNIETAKVLTVGANPSSGEFNKNRDWPEDISNIDLQHRLLKYFNLSIKYQFYKMKEKMGKCALFSHY